MGNFNLASKVKNSEFWVSFMCAVGFVVALLAPFDDVKAQSRNSIYDLSVRSAMASGCSAIPVYLVRVVTIYMPPGASDAPSSTEGHWRMLQEGSRALSVAKYQADSRVVMR